MGKMADLLDAMAITVFSPDGRIQAVLRNRDEITVSFNGTYVHYTERALAPELSGLFLRLWTGYDRGHDQAMAEATGLPIARPRVEPDAQARRYHAEAAKTSAEGISAQHLVYMRTTGRRSCDVVIRDGTLRRLNEEQFVAELMSAYRTMSSKYSGALFQLRDKHFGRYPGSKPIQ